MRGSQEAQTEVIFCNVFLFYFVSWFAHIAVPVYVVCRRGNDSQIAVQLLKDYFEKQSSAGKDASSIVVKDIVGGLSLWTDEVDSQFPKY